jgi:hypothetical protein
MGNRIEGLKDRLQGAIPDEPAQAEIRGMAGELDDILTQIMPDKALAPRLREFADYTQELVERLGGSSANIGAAADELSVATATKLGSAFTLVILPGLLGSPQFNGKDALEVMRPMHEIMRMSKELQSVLRGDPVDIAIVRARAANLASAASDLVRLAAAFEGKTDM